MVAVTLSRDQIIDASAKLPSFPGIVIQLLESIDDPDGCLKDVVNFVNHDPLIAARVLSAANSASARARRDRVVNDIPTALALIGMSTVRKIALIGGVGNFVKGMSSGDNGLALWRHSVAVGVACEELCMYLQDGASTDMALIAGLLHDIGQFWFFSHNADQYRQCWSHALEAGIAIETVERETFGVDHSVVGAWLAQHWGLPSEICQAISAHHAPGNEALREPLVPLVHVAEVVSNALDLMGQGRSRVSFLSAPACRSLGIVWDEDVREVFGRIEARSIHANSFFV